MDTDEPSNMGVYGCKNTPALSSVFWGTLLSPRRVSTSSAVLELVPKTSQTFSCSGDKEEGKDCIWSHALLPSGLKNIASFHTQLQSINRT